MMRASLPAGAAAVAVAAIAGCAFLLDSKHLDQDAPADASRVAAESGAPDVTTSAEGAREAASADSGVPPIDSGPIPLDAGPDVSPDTGPVDSAIPDAGDDGAPPVAVVNAGIKQLVYASDRKGWDIVPSGSGQTHDWYTTQFFGGPTTPDAAVAVSDAGVLTLGCDACAVGSVQTEAPGSSGAAYGHGYFEATLAFDPVKAAQPGGAVAFWSISHEHAAMQDFVDGSSTFESFAQVDFAQTSTTGKPWADTSAYQTEVHAFSGVFGMACDASFCETINAQDPSLTVDAGTDYTRPHRYGCLWTQGRVDWLFDGVVDNSFAFDAGSPFAVLDAQHLILVVSAGNDSPVTVARVRVWR